MKALITSLVFAVSSILPAGWGEINIVDSFGDRTGEVTLGTAVKGTFSNSATLNSDLVVLATLFENRKDPLIRLKFYEYNDNPANFYGSDIVLIQIKVDGREIDELNLKGYVRKINGGLYIVDHRKKNKTSLYDIIRQYDGEIRFVVTVGSGYGTPTVYKFTLNGLAGYSIK